MKILNRKELTLFQKLQFCLGIDVLYHGHIVGYCNIHQIYFYDFRHTNDEIRCPICDRFWLEEHTKHQAIRIHA